MKAFKNVNAYIEGQGIINTNVYFENGIITYIGNARKKADEIISCSGSQIVLPGFIDEHTHGAMGCDAMDGKISSLSAIASAIASEGTTLFLATTMTQSEKNILSAMKAVAEYKSQSNRNGAQLLGVHLEGPFISLKHVGVQPREYVVAPDIVTFEKYNKASGNNIKIVSLAPEEDKNHALIKYLKKNGIVASAGHTDGGYEDVKSAIADGLSSVTHTFNAQKGIHHREIGTAGSALLFDNLNCEIIADLIHVSVPAIKLLIKNKPKDKITLVTDSMRAKYMTDGISELGGQTVYVKNGEPRLSDGTLAASVLKMNVAVKNLVEKVGVKLEDAVDFATINPAKNLAIDGEYGSIKVGKKANFTVIDKDFSVIKTLREGNTVFSRD